VKIADGSLLGQYKDLNELSCSVPAVRFREIVDTLIGAAKSLLEIGSQKLELLLTENRQRDAALFVYSDLMPLIVKLPSGIREFEMLALSKKTKTLGITLANLKEFLKCELQREKLLQEEPDEPDRRPAPLANFLGLVDIVEVILPGEKPGTYDKKLVYLVLDDDGSLNMFDTYTLNGRSVAPPSRDKVPFPGAKDVFPQAVEVMRHYHEDDDGSLYDDIVTFLKNNTVLPDEKYYDLLAAWAMHTYLMEKFHYSPYLWFYATYMRGKSRTGKALVYMAYRGIHVEGLREAFILRAAEHWGATIFFDLVDLMKKAEAGGSDDIIMSRYERGIYVFRVQFPDKGAHEDTVSYHVFGATVIATNHAIGQGMETRAIQINMPEAAVTYEPMQPITALPLKERLIAFRARHLHTEMPEVKSIACNRLGDITKPLLQIVHLVKPDRVPVLVELIHELDSERKKTQSLGLDAQIVEAILKLKEAEKVTVSEGKECFVLNDLVDILNEDKSDKDKVSNKYIQSKLKPLGIEFFKKHSTTRRALYQFDQEVLILLATRYGLKEDISSEDPPCSLREPFESFGPFEPIVVVSEKTRSVSEGSPEASINSLGFSKDLPEGSQDPSINPSGNNRCGYELSKHPKGSKLLQREQEGHFQHSIPSHDFSLEALEQSGPWPRWEV
jgi:hypothetical protein